VETEKVTSLSPGRGTLTIKRARTKYLQLKMLQLKKHHETMLVCKDFATIHGFSLHLLYKVCRSKVKNEVKKSKNTYNLDPKI